VLATFFFVNTAGLKVRKQTYEQIKVYLNFPLNDLFATWF